MQDDWQRNIAVLYDGVSDTKPYQQLAAQLGIPLISGIEFGKNPILQFYLSWQDGRLSLLDKDSPNASGLTIEIEHRQGEQRSWPIAKNGCIGTGFGA